MNTQEDKDYDFRHYENMPPEEVVNTYIVGIGVKEDMTIQARQMIIIFLMKLLGESITELQEANLVRMLGRKSFQKSFVLIIGSLMLVLEHVEAYELLAKLQAVINEMAAHETLKNNPVWACMPVKPDHLKQK